MQPELKDLFREKAFKRIFSHEEAEEQFVLLPSKSYYAFFWFLALIFLFFSWLLLGKIPLEFQGKSILLNQKEMGHPIQDNPSGSIMYGFISANIKDAIQLGTAVQIQPLSIDQQEYGYLLGKIIAISSEPISLQELSSRLDNAGLANYLLHSSPLSVEVTIEPLLNPSAPSGYQWSSGLGPPKKLPEWTLSNIRGVIRYENPMVELLPVWVIEKAWNDLKTLLISETEDAQVKVEPKEGSGDS